MRLISKFYKGISASSVNNIVSIILNGIGLLSLFLATVLASLKFSNSDFIRLSLLLNYFSIVGSIGLLGSEQLLLRSVSIEKESISLTTSSIKLVMISMVIAFCLIPISFSSNFSINLGDTLIILILGNLIFLSHQLLKIIGDNIKSQAILQLPRLLILISVLYISFSQNPSLSLKLMFTLSLLLPTSLGIIWIFRKLHLLHLKTRKIKPEDYYLLFAFFFSLATLSIISYVDKFIAEKYFDQNEVFNYFIMLTFSLAPFNLAQNLKSFFLYRVFKTKSKSQLLNYNFDIVLFIICSIISLIIFYIYQYLKEDLVITNLETVIYFILIFSIGYNRIIYSQKSIQLGLKGSTKEFFTINTTSLLLFITLVPVAISKSNQFILLGITLLIWIQRNLMLKKYGRF